MSRGALASRAGQRQGCCGSGCVSCLAASVVRLADEVGSGLVVRLARQNDWQRLRLYLAGLSELELVHAGQQLRGQSELLEAGDRLVDAVARVLHLHLRLVVARIQSLPAERQRILLVLRLLRSGGRRHTRRRQRRRQRRQRVEAARSLTDTSSSGHRTGRSDCCRRWGGGGWQCRGRLCWRRHGGRAG